ncbi:MAG: hypothetical protein ACREN3_09465, partial [Gemmatimonadaceae bacterium]
VGELPAGEVVRLDTAAEFHDRVHRLFTAVEIFWGSWPATSPVRSLVRGVVGRTSKVSRGGRESRVHRN